MKNEETEKPRNERTKERRYEDGETKKRSNGEINKGMQKWRNNLLCEALASITECPCQPSTT